MRESLDDDGYEQGGYWYDEPGEDGWHEYDDGYRTKGASGYESGHGDQSAHPDNGEYGHNDLPYDDTGADRGSRTGIWFALGVTIGLIAGAGGTLLATSALELPQLTSNAGGANQETVAADGDEDQIVNPVDAGTTAAGATGDTGPQPTGVAESAGSDGNTDQPPIVSGEQERTSDEPGSSSTVSDLLGCTIDGSGLPILEVVNHSSALSDYQLSISLRDHSGSTVIEQPGEIYALRAGERTIEHVVVDQPGGVECEVVNLVRRPVDITIEAAADASDCEILGPNPLNEISATLSVTNHDSVPSDYFVDVAIVDTDGLRRGTGFVAVDGVASGETVQADVDSIVSYMPGLQCQVVGILRTAS